jgi:hypothetical protein
VPTLQGGESPMPDSGSPVASHDGGRNVPEPSASNAGQRPVSRREALAYDSSLAAALAAPTDRRVEVHCGRRRLRRDQDVVADGRQQPGQRHRGSPKAVTANAFRTPTATLAQGAGDPTRLASIVGAGLSPG